MTPLHLVQAPLRMRAFTQWALDRGFLSVPRGDGQGRPREPELGYALHAALAGLFGGRAPRPFCVPPANGGRRRAPLGDSADALPLLGYSALDREGLSALAEFADQEFRDLFDCDSLRTRSIPAEFPQGLRFGFDLRACPVRRRKPSLPFTTNLRSKARKVTYSSGTEVDAFQLATVRAEHEQQPIPRRDEVYAEWLREKFAGTSDRPSPLRLVEESVRVRSFRSTRLLRRPRNGNGRSPQWLTRPEVWFSGQVEVVSGSAVPAFLSRGIGRHCGFGFGMMLLRPA